MNDRWETSQTQTGLRLRTGKPGKAPKPLYYPESDGKPPAQSLKQWRLMTLIVHNLETLFEGRNDVWIGRDQFWYPEAELYRYAQAPDVFVVFDVPNDDRNVYQQWKENGTAPQVIIEILSPSNRPGELNRKYEFYHKYGVEEYYIIDPDFRLVKTGMEAYLRENGAPLWKHIVKPPFVSPRLGVSFTVEDEKLCFYHPNGAPFLSYAQEQRRAKEEKARAEMLAEFLRKQGFDPDNLPPLKES